MGREVRQVPADWQHPQNEFGRAIPLKSGDLVALQAEWDEGFAKWSEGLRFNNLGVLVTIEARYSGLSYSDWTGRRPVAEEYMPQWPASLRTHFQMYETTSEGTPISPVFATPQELARWLADTGASAFGPMKASYDEWLATIEAGSVASMVSITDGDGSGAIVSGVSAAGGSR
ncbi:MAG: hypothetical protein ACYDGM_12170 [Vulcanimicrobiaceae bacterium]